MALDILQTKLPPLGGETSPLIPRPDLPEIPTSSRPNSDTQSEIDRALAAQEPLREQASERYGLESELMRQKIEQMKRNRGAQHKLRGGITGASYSGTLAPGQNTSGGAMNAPVSAVADPNGLSLADRTSAGKGPGSLADRLKSSSAARIAGEQKTRGDAIAGASRTAQAQGAKVAADMRLPAAPSIADRAIALNQGLKTRAASLSQSPGVRGPVSIRDGTTKVTADSAGRVAQGPSVTPSAPSVLAPSALAMSPSTTTAPVATPTLASATSTTIRPNPVATATPHIPVPSETAVQPSAPVNRFAEGDQAAKEMFGGLNDPILPKVGQAIVEGPRALDRVTRDAANAVATPIASLVKSGYKNFRNLQQKGLIPTGESRTAARPANTGTLPSGRPIEPASTQQAIVRSRIGQPPAVRQVAVPEKRNPLLANR